MLARNHQPYKSISSASSNSFQRAHQPLVALSVSPDCEICVVIPARNEAANITRALEALAHQTELNCARAVDFKRYEVIVLANNCTDETAYLARRFAAAKPDFNLHVAETTFDAACAHVGTARRLAMDEAARRLTSVGRASIGIIASTDADTCVSTHWIAATIAAIAQGADAVGGRIVVNQIAESFDEALTPRLARSTRLTHLRDVTYRYLAAELEACIAPEPHDPSPRHHQHFGASLAVTVAAYKQAGCLPVTPYLEDLAFYQALLRIDARVRHSPQVRVVTSSRRGGRVAVGLSVQLKEWHAMAARNEPYLVDSASSLEGRARLKKCVRQAWQAAAISRFGETEERDLEKALQAAELDANWLRAELTKHKTFGALWEMIEQKQAKKSCYTKTRDPKKHQAAGDNLCEVTHAIRDLRQLIAKIKRASPPLSKSSLSSPPSSSSPPPPPQSSPPPTTESANAKRAQG